MASNGDFEFDKIMVAIAIGFVSIIFSADIGDLIYNPCPHLEKRGFQIEVVETAGEAAGGAAPELPATLDMHTIMAAADTVKGAIVFKKCATCHVAEKGAPNKVGPNLWGIVGAKTATREGFAYSSAMTGRGAEGKIWGFEDLYRYIYSPKKYVPGTKMAFAGIKNDQERADVIAYLRQNADVPQPMP